MRTLADLLDQHLSAGLIVERHRHPFESTVHFSIPLSARPLDISK
jgi:hypothetical protein